MCCHETIFSGDGGGLHQPGRGNLGRDRGIHYRVRPPVCSRSDFRVMYGSVTT